MGGCFEKAKEVSMKDFVDTFDKLLTREQVKRLIYKLENEKLLLKIKAQKYTRYILNHYCPVKKSGVRFPSNSTE